MLEGAWGPLGAAAGWLDGCSGGGVALCRRGGVRGGVWMEQGRVYTCSATSDFLGIDLGRPIVEDTCMDTCSRICCIVSVVSGELFGWEVAQVTDWAQRYE